MPPVTLPPGALGQLLLASDFTPEVQGPNLLALVDSFEAMAARLVAFPGELFAAIDIRPPVWDPTRPPYHLALQCKYYKVARDTSLSDAAQYRRVRMTDIARHAHGMWAGLLRWAAAAASVDNVTVSVDLAGHAPGTPSERKRVSVHLGPLVAVVFFSKDFAPAAAELSAYKDLWRTAIQDVAGYQLLIGNPDDCFRLDISPGLDSRKLCGPL